MADIYDDGFNKLLTRESESDQSDSPLTNPIQPSQILPGSLDLGKIQILPNDTDGFVAKDSDGNVVFKIISGGDDEGDAIMGDTSGEHAKWDKSTSTFKISGNLVLGRLTYSKHVLAPTFESVDGWTVSVDGIVTPVLGSVSLQTDTTAGKTVHIHAETLAGTGGAGEPSNSNAVDFTKNPVLQAYAAVDWGGASGDTDATFYIAMGAFGSGVCGFKVTDEKLYSFYNDAGGEQTNQITGITLLDTDPIWNNYRLECSSSGGTTTMNFYVNDTLKDTQSTSYFTSSTSSMYFKVTNVAAKNMVMNLKSVVFSQDL